MIDVICLNGPPRSGKDFIGQMIYSSKPIGCHILKFAKPIEEIAKQMLGYSDELFQHYREKSKDKNLPDLNFTMRELMIDISENLMKPRFGQAHFGELAGMRVKEELNIISETMVFTDTGFQSEFDALQKSLDPKHYQLHLVNIVRNGKNFDNDSREYITNKNGKTIQFDNNIDKSDLVNFVENGKNLMMDLGLMGET